MADLEDFEAFLEDDFNPVRFAASLIQATNVVDDTELDLATPLKKLQFDVNECNKRMELLASTHYKELLQNLDKLDEKKRKMTEIIDPSAARLRSAFDRIQTDVIAPYDEALKLNNALEKIHKTSALLRDASFFFVFLKQLLEYEKHLDMAADNREIVRLAKTYNQISRFFSNPGSFYSSDLLSLKIVRDYTPIFEVKCADFQADLSSKITNDMAHHSSFNPSNLSLQYNILALYVIDEKKLWNLIDDGPISKSIQISLAQLTRSLQSPRTLASAFTEVKQSTTNFSDKLSGLLANCKMSKIDSNAENRTLLDAFLKTVVDSEGESIEEVYWSRMSFKFKKNVAATMARGGPIARTLRSQYTMLVEAADSTLEGFSVELIKNALSLIGGKS